MVKFRVPLMHVQCGRLLSGHFVYGGMANFGKQDVIRRLGDIGKGNPDQYKAACGLKAINLLTLLEKGVGQRVLENCFRLEKGYIVF